MQNQSKRQLQLLALIEKEEAAKEQRLAQLKARLEKEQSKTKELKLDDEGIADLLLMLSNTAEKNGVSVLKLLDFAGKQAVGETFKAVYRRKREPRAPKEPKAPKAPAAKKTAAKK